MTEDGQPKIYAIVNTDDIEDIHPTFARRIAAMGPIMLGLALVLGGDGRFKTPGFAAASALAPAWVWGAGFLFVGVGMALHAWEILRTVFWMAYLATVLFAFWTACLTVASVRYHAPWTGPAVYSWATLITAGVAARDSDRIVRRYKKIIFWIKNRLSGRR